MKWGESLNHVGVRLAAYLPLQTPSLEWESAVIMGEGTDGEVGLQNWQWCRCAGPQLTSSHLDRDQWLEGDRAWVHRLGELREGPEAETAVECSKRIVLQSQCKLYYFPFPLFYTSHQFHEFLRVHKWNHECETMLTLIWWRCRARVMRTLSC